MTPIASAESLAAAAEPSLGVPVPAEPPAKVTPRALGTVSIIRFHQAILEMTAEVFPGGRVEVEEAVDPEIPGDPYLVVKVATGENEDEVVARFGEWHRRLRAVADPTADSYRLLLDTP